MKQLLIVTLVAAGLIGCGKKEETSKPAPPNVEILKAAGEGNLEAVKQHIAAGTDLNQRGVDQNTPLMIAITFGRLDVAKALIKGGAKLDLKNKDGNTALLSAAFL